MTEAAAAQETAQPQEQQTTEAPTASEAEQLTTAVAIKDGRIFFGEEDLGLSPEELKNVGSLKRAAYKNFEEAAKLRKEWEAEKSKFTDVNYLLANPELANALDQYHQEKYAREYDEIQAREMQKNELLNQNLSPEQIELLMQAQAVISENKLLKERQEREALEAQERQKEEAIIAYQKEVLSAYESALKSAGLAPTPERIQRMKEYHMSVIGTEEEERIDESTLADFIKTSTKDDVSSLIGDLQDDGIIELLGEDIVKRIVKAHTARMQKSAKIQGSKKDAAPQDAERPSRPMRSFGLID